MVHHKLIWTVFSANQVCAYLNSHRPTAYTGFTFTLQ
ncbi:hypothetical protein BVRB_8g197540 [Beta vulgaris subsp. vulgaris]|nr:hypothetical protein BVRB_8g197540 [Beta vulgaris subsp. vulgaris]